jgi:tetratricopeptide (TPR) repeat protein
MQDFTDCISRGQKSYRLFPGFLVVQVAKMTQPNSSILMPVRRLRFSSVYGVAFILCLLCSREDLTRVEAHVRATNNGPAVDTLAQQAGGDGRLLELGKAIEREMTGGQSHSYQLPMTSGQYALVVVEQKKLDVVVKLFAPDGKLITAVDSPNGRLGPEPVHITAETTGIYRLEVISFQEDARPGRYEATLVEQRPATHQDLDRLAARRAFDEGERLRNQKTRDSLEAAINKFEEALSLYHAIGDVSEQYTVLLGMGNTYRMRREPQKALERIDQSLQIARALGDHYRQGR